MADLAPEHRTRLDSIVQQMQSAGESDTSIQAVVDDFKSKYAAMSGPEPSVLHQALSNLPSSLLHMIQAYAPGPSGGPDLYAAMAAHPGENPLNPINAIRDTLGSIGSVFAHPQDSFAADPLATVNTFGLPIALLHGGIKNMGESIPTMHPAAEWGAEHLLHLPGGSIQRVRKIFGNGGSGPIPPVGPQPPPWTSKPGFSEGWTTDPQFHGALGPVPPSSTPSPFNITRGTATPPPTIDPLAGTNIVLHPSGDFVPGSATIPPVVPIKEGSPVPANASSFRHPADYTDLIRQFHATHPRGTSLRDLSAKVYGTAPGTMPTYDQALALHEWLLRNPGKTPTPGLK